MPQGDKSSYTDKQKRKAAHIEEGYEKRGVSEQEAERRAWATVNKESGAGKKSGSGRGKPETHEASSRGGRKSAAGQSHAEDVAPVIPPAPGVDPRRAAELRQAHHQRVVQQAPVGQVVE